MDPGSTFFSNSLLFLSFLLRLSMPLLFSRYGTVKLCLSYINATLRSVSRNILRSDASSLAESAFLSFVLFARVYASSLRATRKKFGSVLGRCAPWEISLRRENSRVPYSLSVAIAVDVTAEAALFGALA